MTTKPELRYGVEYKTIGGEIFTIPESRIDDTSDTVMCSDGGFRFVRSGPLWDAGQYCGFTHVPRFRQHVDWSAMESIYGITIPTQMELFE